MVSERPCPDCGESIKRSARVCRYCGWGKQPGCLSRINQDCGRILTLLIGLMILWAILSYGR